MKKFSETKFGSFLSKVGSTGLNVVSVITKATSGNILGAINDAKNLLGKQSSFESQELLDILQHNEDDFKTDFDKYLEDVKDAREMYQNTSHDIADEIAQKVIRINLPIIGILIVINVLSVWLLQGKGEVIAIVSNFIGIAIANLFNERQSVINFFFGSSKGSKDKSKILNI